MGQLYSVMYKLDRNAQLVNALFKHVGCGYYYIVFWNTFYLILTIAIRDKETQLQTMSIIYNISSAITFHYFQSSTIVWGERCENIIVLNT